MIPNPMVWIASKAAGDYHKLSCDLGMTPVSRSRIAPVEPPDDDPAEEFFR